MSGKRYPETFKIEATKQVTERGHKVSDVANRLGVTPKSIHDWIKRYGDNTSNPSHPSNHNQQEEIRRLKAELRRVTEERNILKEAAAFFAGESKKDTRS